MSMGNLLDEAGQKDEQFDLHTGRTDEVSIRSRLRLLSYPCFICVSSVAYLNYFLATDETRMNRVHLVAAERSEAALGVSCVSWFNFVKCRRGGILR